MNKEQENNNSGRHSLPDWLITKEISDPHQVLAGFFAYWDLQECRITLKDWLYAALTSEECQQPADLVFFHEGVERLIEAVWMLYQQQAPRGSSYTIRDL